MSEASSPHLYGLFQLHLRSQRTPEDVAVAFLDCFQSIPGRIVLESLFDAWCMTQAPEGQEVRWEGKRDAWLEIVDLMAKGNLVKYGGESWRAPTQQPWASPEQGLP